MNEVRWNRPAVRGSAGDDGLTIVELLVALVIVMIVFAGLAATLIASFTSIRNNEARVRAVALANELVEEMAEVPWRHLGLLDDDPDLFDSEGELRDSNVCDGEELVLLEAAGGEDDPFLNHSEVIERDGREYQVERCVVRVEGLEGSEVIEMVVHVSWTVGGEELTIRSDGLRSSDSQDLFDLEVEVEVEASGDHASSDGTAMLLHHAESDGVLHHNRARIDVTATLGVVSSSVELRFRDRNGDLWVRQGADAEMGESERTWSISPNTYAFVHGLTPFTVVATGPQGQVASDTANLRAFQVLDVQRPVVSQDDQVVWEDDEQVASVVTDGTGAVCGEPLRVEVDVEGMTSGEARQDADGEGGLTLTWSGEPEDGPVEMQLVEGTEFGGRFYVDDVANLETEVDAEFTVFTISADRISGLDDERFDDKDTFTFNVDVVQVEECL